MQIQNIIKVALVGLLLLFSTVILTSCFERVPPAYKGKILTGSGFQEEVLEPGRYFVLWWQNLILLDTSTKTFAEPMQVILQDRLTLDFDVRFRARIAGDDKVINMMFNDIQIDKNTNVLDLNKVYSIYGRMILQNKSREVVSQFSIDEVHKNYGRISGLLAEAILPELDHTPIEFNNVTIANIRFPDVITKAVEVAKERELDIQREKAQNEIDLLRKENERALAEADYQTRLTKARTIRDENKMIAEGVTPELLQFYSIEVQKEFAAHAGKQGNYTFMPIASLDTVGANVRMYQK